MAALAEKFAKYGGMQADYQNPDDFDRNFRFYYCGYTDALKEAVSQAKRISLLQALNVVEQDVDTSEAILTAVGEVVDAIRALGTEAKDA